MIPRRSRAIGADRGSITLVAAGVMALACVICIATVDVSRAELARARAQTAADAAALAAAQEIAVPSGETPADAARTFAERNGASLSSCQCPSGAAEAVVEVDLPVSFILFGSDRTVTARARAVIGLP